MQMWLVRTRSLMDWAQLERVLPRHLANEAELAGAGALVMAGPLPTPTGSLDGDGLTLYHAESAEAARTLALSDPFVHEGIRKIVAVELWDVRCVGWRAGDVAALAQVRA